MLKPFLRIWIYVSKPKFDHIFYSNRHWFAAIFCRHVSIVIKSSSHWKCSKTKEIHFEKNYLHHVYPVAPSRSSIIIHNSSKQCIKTKERKRGNKCVYPCVRLLSLCNSWEFSSMSSRKWLCMESVTLANDQYLFGNFLHAVAIHIERVIILIWLLDCMHSPFRPQKVEKSAFWTCFSRKRWISSKHSYLSLDLRFQYIN